MHPDENPERIFGNGVTRDGLRVNGPYPSLTEGDADILDVTGFAWRNKGRDS